MDPLLPLDRASVFFDGTLHQPQLNHPEGLAIAPDGAVWCGGTGGEIYRIAPDGSAMEEVASTGGLVLGLAFDRNGLLYICDIKHHTVLRLDPAEPTPEPFAKPRPGPEIALPNFPVVDHERNCLYVSDSNAKFQPGMGIWRFDLDSGEGELWWDEPMNFANGMALSADGATLYVAETFGHLLTAVRIAADGTASAAEPVLENLDGTLDGLALAADGSLYLSYFGPSKITRLDDGAEQLVIYDPHCELLCHPTNIAWRGTDLFAANLGAFHLTKVDLGIAGHPLL